MDCKYMRMKCLTAGALLGVEIILLSEPPFDDGAQEVTGHFQGTPCVAGLPGGLSPIRGVAHATTGFRATLDNGLCAVC